MADKTNPAQTMDDADLDLSFYEELDTEAVTDADDAEAGAAKGAEGNGTEEAESKGTAAAGDGTEQGQAQTGEKSADADKAGSQTAASDGAKKAPQSAEQNAEFARRRREAETQEKIAAAKEEARVNAIIEAVGENPYTKKPIKDAEDVDQYLLMKKIANEGGDPIEDFPEYSKRQNAERAAAAKATAEAGAAKVATATKDLTDFKAKYPTVDLQELAQDADFNVFCSGKLGNIPLTDIYDQYQGFKSRLVESVQKQKEDAAVSKKAKENAAVGSLASTDDAAANGLYTIEQLKSMSEEDIEANWEKVKKSQAALKL